MTEARPHWRHGWRHAAIRAWLPLLFLAVWQVLAQLRILNPLLFPPPSRLMTAAGRMLSTGELTGHLRATLTRMATGLAMGSAAGLFCGLAMGASAAVRRSLEFLISGLYSTPKLALLPVVMLLVGVGEKAGIILIAATSFGMMAIHCLDAVRNLNRAYVDLAVNYGAGRGAVFWKVYLPGCLPQIFTGFRLAAGRALVMTISVEMIIAPNGLGSLIWMAWQTFTIEKLYVAVLLIAGIGAMSHYALRWCETRLIPWQAAGSSV